jgi:hypothetical protein
MSKKTWIILGSVLAVGLGVGTYFIVKGIRKGNSNGDNK